MPHFKMACYAIIGLVVLAFGGCAPSTAAKTELPPPAPSGAPTEPPGSAEGQG
jgi:hypothetical protein